MARRSPDAFVITISCVAPVQGPYTKIMRSVTVLTAIRYLNNKRSFQKFRGKKTSKTRREQVLEKSSSLNTARLCCCFCRSSLTRMSGSGRVPVKVNCGIYMPFCTVLFMVTVKSVLSAFHFRAIWAI